MKIYTRDNYVSANTQSYSSFEDMVAAPQMEPPAIVTNKEMWKDWLSAPTTRRHVYSYVGGVQPTQIVSANNMLFDVNGFIFDVDEAIPLQDLLDAIELHCPDDIRPTYIVESYSSRWHLLYPFDGSVGMLDGQEYAAVATVFHALAKLGKVSAKVDIKAMTDPTQYYTYGRRWLKPYPTKTTVISKNDIHTIQYQVGNSGLFDASGVIVPFDKVQEEMDRRFPGHGYTQVADGVRGKRFWDPTSTDPTAAVIRTTGMQYFSDMGGFMSWSAIFGEAFVRKHQSDSIGAALANIYFDGNRYYHRVRDEWAIDTLETVKNLLKVRYNLSTKIIKGKGHSQLDEVLCHIQEAGRVSGALPFLFKDDLVVNYDGRRWVNLASTKPMRPSEYSPTAWGDKFPNLANWLNHFYGDEHQKNIFLAWLRVYYWSALRGLPSKGQVLINVGGVHIGKTLLVTQVISRMFGTSNDIAPFVAGEETFNKEMFFAGVNYIDDQVGFSNFKVRERFSSMLKKLVANTEVAFSAKFKDTQKLPFHSRIVVSMNDDPQSLEVLPMLTDSVKDKVILLKCNDKPYVFPPGFQMQDLIIPELPYFCRWLLNWTAPAETTANNRYQVCSYLHPVLEAEARADDEEDLIRNLLIAWRKSYFRSIEAKGETSVWRSTTQLFGDLKSFDPVLEPELKNRWTTIRFGRILTRVVSRYKLDWIHGHRKTSGFGYDIDRPKEGEDGHEDE
jgi:hypothetical protein